MFVSMGVIPKIIDSDPFGITAMFPGSGRLHRRARSRFGIQVASDGDDDLVDWIVLLREDVWALV